MTLREITKVGHSRDKVITNKRDLHLSLKNKGQSFLARNLSCVGHKLEKNNG